MPTIPTTEPTSITAGDTLSWSKSLADYPATEWTLKYRLVNAAGKVDITAAADGSNYLVGVTSAISAGYAAGTYAWTAWLEKTGERVTVGSGTLIIKPDLAVQNSFDARTDAAIVVDQLMAAYKTFTATQGHVAEYEIAGRKMKYRSSAEILDALNHWKAILAAEKRAERIAAGFGAGGKLLVRF